MQKKIIIVGAGVAGLTLAERLTKQSQDAQVTVIEKENSPGGLARTFQKDGFYFDIGPHRFHTSDQTVEEYLLEILGDDHISIPRASSVFMAGKYRDWPLTLGSVMRLPVPVLVKSLLDLFHKQKIEHIETFADDIISRYGNNLYQFFFKDYTKKFTGISADELHVDWAAAGVNRAVIDKKVKADSLLLLAKGLLLPKPVATSFYYPSKGGIQTFCELQVSRIEAGGGEVIFGNGAVGVEESEGRIIGVRTADGKILKADAVYWSAPISILYPHAGFRFMNTLICNIALKREQQQNNYQWCYFGSKDILFSRLTIPRHFRDDTVPKKGMDSIVVEITLDKNDSFWQNPESIKDRLVGDLQKVNALKKDDILFIDYHRVYETYPLYDLNYRERIENLDIPNGLTLLGRCGSFWYNNMDHSIGEALALSKGESFKKDFCK